MQQTDKKTDSLDADSRETGCCVRLLFARSAPEYGEIPACARTAKINVNKSAIILAKDITAKTKWAKTKLNRAEADHLRQSRGAENC